MRLKDVQGVKLEKSDVIEFFAGLASKWDTEYTAKNEDVINTILDNAE